MEAQSDLFDIIFTKIKKINKNKNTIWDFDSKRVNGDILDFI